MRMLHPIIIRKRKIMNWMIGLETTTPNRASTACVLLIPIEKGLSINSLSII